MKEEKLNQDDFQRETLDFSEMEEVEGGKTGCGATNGKCVGTDSGCGLFNGKCSETGDQEPGD